MSAGRVAVVGAGNVGAALVIELAGLDRPPVTQVWSRDPADAWAAVLDAASAHPDAARWMSPVERLTGPLDVVVICLGAQWEGEPGVGRADLLAVNVDMAVATTVDVGDASTYYVLVGSPVDEVAQEFARTHPRAHRDRVLGFGGDLDRNRLAWSLARRGLGGPHWAVGEHGSRTIPAYPGEIAYDEVSDDVRGLLGRIKTSSHPPRNLASGVLLARLVADLLSGGPPTEISVSTSYQDTGLWLTWPHLLDGDKLLPMAIDLGPRARADLDRLITLRGAAAQR